MPQHRIVNMSALNIKTQPHSTENYIDLLETVYRLKSPRKIRGSDWGMIGALHRVKMEELGETLSGQFYKFLNIDPRGEWLDLNEGTPIKADDDSGIIPPVPDNLKPNLKHIDFVFSPKKHRLFFDKKNISPGMLRFLLNNMFSDPYICDKFGMVDVVAESTAEAIEKILRIQKLTKLEIEVSIPNDDVLSNMEEGIINRLKKQNIWRHNQTATSTSEEGIIPDEETRALMNLGKSEGYVKGKGIDGQRKVNYSTEHHPLIEKVRYDPDVQTKLQAMLLGSLSMLSKISNGS